MPKRKPYVVTLTYTVDYDAKVTVEATSAAGACDLAMFAYSQDDGTVPDFQSSGFDGETFISMVDDPGTRIPVEYSQIGATLGPCDAPVHACQRAEELLRMARDLLVRAGASRAADKVRLAITSAGGAVRHAQGIAHRKGGARG